MRVGIELRQFKHENLAMFANDSLCYMASLIAYRPVPHQYINKSHQITHVLPKLEVAKSK